jgi:hypothetical protein
MPFSSTFIHSKLSKAKLDTSLGVLTDISDACDEVDMPEELELIETTTFGATSKTYLVGFADGKISLGGPWSRNLHTHFGALKVAFRDGTISSASFEYGPEGTDSGDIKISCETVLTSFQKTSAAKEAVRWKAELQITGTVTETTY